MKEMRYIKRENLLKTGWTEQQIELRLGVPDIPCVDTKQDKWKKTKIDKAICDTPDLQITLTQYKLAKIAQAKAKKEQAARNNKARKERRKNEEKTILDSVNIRNPAMDYPEARKIKRHFILQVGSTNTGKTYTALQAMKRANSGTYLSPLRLLAMEVSDNLIEEGIPCSLSTGEEEHILPDAKYVAATVEKANYMETYEVAVIDECQMLSDRDRGGSWAKAIFGLKADTIYLCMAPEAEQICIELINLCGDSYEVHHCERLVPLVFDEKPVWTKDLKRGDAIIVFSRRAVLEFAQELEKEGYKVSVVYGALPYAARKHEVEQYRNGETDIVVSTDAIGMGLNLPIQRIIFAKDTKFDGRIDRFLKPTEIKQIAGRAGRYKMYDTGYVACFAPTKVNGRIIRTGLNVEVEPIEKIVLSFPVECISDTISLSQSIRAWKRIKYPDMFLQQDVDSLVQRVQHLEKKYSKTMGKETMYKLATIFFDEDRQSLMEEWQKYVDDYVNGRSIEIPCFREANDLQFLEDYYKSIDLYYSFCKTVGEWVDESLIASIRHDICNRINNALMDEKKNHHYRHCNQCGKKLPAFFSFGICEDCFHRRQHYWY